MHRSGKGKNVASVLKYHCKMWYNFAVPHFAVPNFAAAKIPPPPHLVLINRLSAPLLISVFASVHTECGISGH